MDVREWQGDIVFLHRVVAGAADKSYGVQVAKLAGLPKPVVNRAQTVLKQLEANGAGADLPLFAQQTMPMMRSLMNRSLVTLVLPLRCWQTWMLMR